MNLLKLPKEHLKKNADAVNENRSKAGGILAYISDLLSEGFQVPKTGVDQNWVV